MTSSLRTTQLTDEPISGAIAPEDWVLAPGTAPRFGDTAWSMHDHIVSASHAERSINIGSIPPGWRLLARETLIVLARPDHPVALDAGIVRRGRPAGPGGLTSRFHLIRTIARWAVSNGAPTPVSWSPLLTRRFVQALEKGEHAAPARPNSAGTIRKYVDTLNVIWQLNDALSEPKMRLDPTGDDRMAPLTSGGTTENVTNPLPWPGWSAIVRASTFVLTDLAPDIIRAEQRRKALPTGGRQGPGTATERLDELVAAGHRIPVHTGRGRSPGGRGTLNRALFCRLAGIAEASLNQASSGFQPELLQRLHTLSSDAVTTGGGLEPLDWATAEAEAWSPEFAPWEVEHLASVVRAAAYLLLAALTGMRDSELQQLERGCVVRHEGDLPALRSLQFKGTDHPGGQERLWFAPRPVFLAIDVLEQLSVHQTLLLTRSATGGAYQYSRDVKRFIEFVNAAPDERVGRGNPLPLEPIATGGVAVNQQTMRRSFAVYSARYPGAELGLGIQLGHAALRMTAGYYLDSQERASRLVDDERRTAMNDVVRSMVDGAPAVGGGADRVRNFAAQSITNPARGARLVEQLAENYHLGQLNDCHYRAALAACGSDGPQLADRRCGTGDCTNAVITQRHIPAWDAQVQRIDRHLAIERVHPSFEASLRATRVEITSMLRPLRSSEET